MVFHTETLTVPGRMSYFGTEECCDNIDRQSGGNSWVGVIFSKWH